MNPWRMVIKAASLWLTALGLALSIPAAAANPEPGASDLEEAAESDSSEAFFAQARSRARAPATSLAEIQRLLVPDIRVYRPEGPGPFPGILLLHGCSGPTPSHESDWARFYAERGVVTLAVDSLGPRQLDWERVCNLETLTGRERAADILAALDYARSLPFIDPERLALSGFSHGAWTIWEFLLLASDQTPPLGLEEWPPGGAHGVRAAFLFYGPCLEKFSVPIPTLVFQAENDRYIDEAACIEHAQQLQRDPVVQGGEFELHVFSGATHTFDHAQPNPANRAAGSVHDPQATRAAQEAIERVLKTVRAPARNPVP